MRATRLGQEVPAGGIIHGRGGRGERARANCINPDLRHRSRWRSQIRREDGWRSVPAIVGFAAVRRGGDRSGPRLRFSAAASQRHAVQCTEAPPPPLSRSPHGLPKGHFSGTSCLLLPPWSRESRTLLTTGRVGGNHLRR
ncbi:hypothetical protein MRX96_013266 [Rhipicephalus microplus]